MNNSEQPVNCPLCSQPPVVCDDEDVWCNDPSCSMVSLHGLKINAWNKAFGPKEIDLDLEYKRFCQWYAKHGEDVSTLPVELGLWMAWRRMDLILENRDE